jgi:hypothetical protein
MYNINFRTAGEYINGKINNGHVETNHMLFIIFDEVDCWAILPF